MVAAETKFFMRASAAVFQNTPPSGSRREGIFRTTLMKKCRKIILPKLDRIFKMNFPTTCRKQKTDFRPSWLEVKNPTSDQLGQK